MDFSLFPLWAQDWLYNMSGKLMSDGFEQEEADRIALEVFKETRAYKRICHWKKYETSGTSR